MSERVRRVVGDHVKKARRNRGPITPKVRAARDLLMGIYEALHAKFGHRNWWPGDSPFEVCVGAVLTQNTSWKNVAKAISNLKAASALDLNVIYSLSRHELAELIRPSGYFNVKAMRLKNFVAYVVERRHADLNSLFVKPVKTLREELLSINGIGKETADSIILYAAEKPIFVVDAYTKRVLLRHGLVSEKEDYDALQEPFHRNLPRDAGLFNDFHAQFVAVGHHYCKRIPHCEQCPLEKFLCEGKPIGVSDQTRRSA
jgi:endonuclease-3 related protein